MSSKARAEIVERVFPKIYQNLEDEFRKTFSKKEIEYIKNLYEHPLLQKLYGFAFIYAEGKDVKKLMSSEVQKEITNLKKNTPSVQNTPTAIKK